MSVITGRLLKAEAGGQLWTSDRPLYLDAGGNVVERDNPNRITKLVGRGGTMPLAEAERLGLTKAKDAAPATKHRSGPKAKKAEE